MIHVQPPTLEFVFRSILCRTLVLNPKEQAFQNRFRFQLHVERDLQKAACIASYLFHHPQLPALRQKKEMIYFQREYIFFFFAPYRRQVADKLRCLYSLIHEISIFYYLQLILFREV